MEKFYKREMNATNIMILSNSAMCDLIQHKIRQEKGQRIFRPIWNTDYKPIEPGCEIFVGRLPRDAFEGELIPLFCSLGQVYECRLMMDFSGLTRGFCYVTYTTKEMADCAVKFLHGLCIRPSGERIYCYHSLDNKRLYLENLPTNRPAAEIEYAIRSQIPGVCRLIFYNNPCRDGKLGVGFIEFMNHKHAANCRKTFWPTKLTLWGQSIFLEWAVPLPNYAKNNLLLIKNLSINLTKSALVKELLRILPDHVNIANIYKRYNYAIVQFLVKQDTTTAVQLLTGNYIGGNPVIPKQFELTEEGEKELMLELQMCEHYAQTGTGNSSMMNSNIFPIVTKQLPRYSVPQTYGMPINVPFEIGIWN